MRCRRFDSDPVHMDIGVVTSVWGDYGKFLPEWISSVCAQEKQPTMITIVDAGTDITAAEQALDGCDIPWQIVTIPYTGMGAARNAAVAHTPTEWVMHLDADDILLPHALSDASCVDADVVALGMRVGEKDVTFPHTSREFVLAGGVGCYSCAPFRRSLWAKRPYITVNDWVDSALWVGFAHEGARFAPTHRVGAIYRQHQGSFSRSLSLDDKRRAIRQHEDLCRDSHIRL